MESEGGADDRIVEAIIDDLESKKIIAQYAVGAKKTEERIGPQQLPNCPKHDQGVQIEIIADNEAAALKGDCEVKVVGCCRIAIEARLNRISKYDGLDGLSKIQRGTSIIRQHSISRAFFTWVFFYLWRKMFFSGSKVAKPIYQYRHTDLAQVVYHNNNKITEMP